MEERTATESERELSERCVRTSHNFRDMRRPARPDSASLLPTTSRRVRRESESGTDAAGMMAAAVDIFRRTSHVVTSSRIDEGVGANGVRIHLGSILAGRHHAE